MDRKCRLLPGFSHAMAQDCIYRINFGWSIMVHESGSLEVI